MGNVPECVRMLLLLQAVHSSGQHSISFTLSRNQTVVVEYCHDNNTDMFQVSRRRRITPFTKPLGMIVFL